jgi:hypothetical protein
MGPGKENNLQGTPLDGDIDPDQLVSDREAPSFEDLLKSTNDILAERSDGKPRSSSSNSRIQLNRELLSRDCNEVEGPAIMPMISGGEGQFESRVILDSKLIELFGRRAGYSLGVLIEQEAPSAVKLTVHELVAVAFKGASGFEQDYVWADSLFSHKHYLPLRRVMDALSLCSPSEEIREDAINLLCVRKPSNLADIFSIAVQHARNEFFVQQIVRRLERISQAEALQVAESALANPLVSTDAMRAKCEELNNSSLAIDQIRLDNKEGASSTREPRDLSTIIFASVHALDEESFMRLVDEALDNHSRLCAPALAALANTRNTTIRDWVTGAFTTRDALKPYSSLVVALPVSARDLG